MKNESQTPDELKERGNFLLECFKHIGQGKPEEKLLQETMHSMNNLLLYYHSKGDKKSLKQLINEIELWILGLDPHDLAVVNKMVFEKFGNYIGEESFFKKINTVLKRGQIKTIVEYRLLIEFLNSFSGDDSRKEMVEKITELVFSYEVKLNKQKKE
jgi:hypothetical protein